MRYNIFSNEKFYSKETISILIKNRSIKQFREGNSANLIDLSSGENCYINK
jgi:hypothetical protein